MEKAAQIVEDEAKRELGTYQPDWPKLKPQTIARKATGDSPLLETGDLRESIEHYVDTEKHEAYVGSNNPVQRATDILKLLPRRPPAAPRVAHRIAQELHTDPDVPLPT